NNPDPGLVFPHPSREAEPLLAERLDIDEHDVDDLRTLVKNCQRFLCVDGLQDTVSAFAQIVGERSSDQFLAVNQEKTRLAHSVSRWRSFAMRATTFPMS